MWQMNNLYLRKSGHTNKNVKSRLSPSGISSEGIHQPISANCRCFIISSVYQGTQLLKYITRKERGLSQFYPHSHRPISSMIFHGSSPCRMLIASFLLRLTFDPEDGGDIFLRNVEHYPIYMALQPKTPYPSQPLP
jgi:hypothetical protein